MRYFVRKDLYSPPIGIYNDYSEAIDNCKSGFRIYNELGDLLAISTKIAKSTICKVDCNGAWKDLKEYYEEELEKARIVKDNHLYKITEIFYEDFLKKMEEIEKKNTIVLGED